VITKGGDQANIIPEYTSAEFYLRATTVAYCHELLRRSRSPPKARPPPPAAALRSRPIRPCTSR